MAFGTIMVNVDFDEDSQDRIHIAAVIANQFGSFLIGVAGWALRGPNDPRLPGMDYRTENAQKKILERLDQLKATFQHCGKNAAQGGALPPVCRPKEDACCGSAAGIQRPNG